MFFTGSMHLVLTNARTGEVLARCPVREGDSFSIMFVHSVNKSPVTDVYKIEDGHIYVEQTIYYGFGAGVQTEIEPGQTLTYGEDGSMIVSGFHQLADGITYAVGTVSDHVLTIGQREISLRDTCGQNTHVAFTLE